MYSVRFYSNVERRYQYNSAFCTVMRWVLTLLMATHPALLSRNLIGGSSGRIAPSCAMDSAAQQN